MCKDTVGLVVYCTRKNVFAKLRVKSTIIAARCSSIFFTVGICRLIGSDRENGNMAEVDVLVSNPEQEDVLQGQEPGASRNSILISDSYEDLAYVLDELCQTNELKTDKRLRSGTINKIRKGEDASPVPKVSSIPNRLAEEGSQNSSSRTTPSIDLNTEVTHLKPSVISFLVWGTL